MLLGPALHFIFQEALEEIVIGELLVHGLAGAEVEGLEDAGEPEALELRRELVTERHGSGLPREEIGPGPANCAGGSGGGAAGARGIVSRSCCRIRLMTP